MGARQWRRYKAERDALISLVSSVTITLGEPPSKTVDDAIGSFNRYLVKLLDEIDVLRNSLGWQGDSSCPPKPGNQAPGEAVPFGWEWVVFAPDGEALAGKREKSGKIFIYADPARIVEHLVRVIDHSADESELAETS